MLYHGFKKSTTSTVILTCHNALMPYCLSKILFIVEKVWDVFVSLLEPVLNQINSSPLHNENRLLACKSEIPWIVQAPNKILIKRIV